MRGRTVIDDGTGVSTYSEGQTGGIESITFTAQIPAHYLSASAVTDVASSEVATGN